MPRSLRFLVLLLLLVTALLPVSAPASPLGSASALEPPSTGGLAAVDRALARLATHRRVLVIAAHPDDEDTTLLTLVSRGMGGEAAYLSLSRGEGGQNLIGPELGVGLGLIRSRELLAARRIDGARQFFTRAFDFGYTRSLEETLRFWPREVLLEDAVRVIRRFRPQVVVSVFPPSQRAGHGQHQAAAVTAEAAFRLAGDPAAFPGLAQEGLEPWQPEALYRSAFFDRAAATLPLPLGGIDPWSGRSIYQLAMASRSMHRSQDMGRLLELGPREGALAWVAGAGEPAAAGEKTHDLFAGIDTHLAAIAAPLPEDRRAAVATHLASVEDLAQRARTALTPVRVETAVPVLAAILGQLRAARELAADGGPARLIDEKIAIAEEGLLAAAGIALDATTEREVVTPGQALKVEAVLWNSGSVQVTAAEVVLAGTKEATPRTVATGELATWQLEAAVPPSASPAVPYFLERPLVGALYDWSEAEPDERGLPFGAPPFVARFRFTVGGVTVTAEREAVYRFRDQALGEIRRPLEVVPRVEVAVAESRRIWPLDRQEPAPLAVTLTSHAAEPLEGRLELHLPEGWPAASAVPFTLRPEEPTVVTASLPPAPGLAPGRYPVEIVAVTSGGERFALAVPRVDYPHIRATPRPEPAVVDVTATDLELPPLNAVGYVRGASDHVPEFLRQVGVPLVLLGPAELETTDLSRFDAVVIGSRAYETEPALARQNGRLLDYVRGGGLLIVQYQQYPFVEGGFSPLVFDIARPHDRVTDETAAVRLVAPDHPVFHTPNEIGPADWQGWVQERGLYFAHTWDAAFTPLLAMADPDGPELQGGLLVAPVGDGTYVYTGLAFFRQLPAGVPGAFRLFANLLALEEPG